MAKPSKDKNVIIQEKSYFIRSALMVGIPTLCNLINTLCGQSWSVHYLNSQRQESEFPLGKIVSGVLLIAVIVIVVVHNIISARKADIIKRSELNKMATEKERLDASVTILSQVQTSTNKICLSKYDTLLEEIRIIENDATHLPTTIISNPCKQLKAIIGYMKTDISIITNIPEHKIRVRVAYRFKNGDWQWISGYASNGYFSIQNLISEMNSTFSHVTTMNDHRESFIFFNRKSLAVQKSMYVYEPHRDYEGQEYSGEENIIDGSILAKSLFIGERATGIYAELAVFIDTTDELLFVNSDSNETIKYTKSLFKDRVFGVYEERLKVELALLYIDNLRRINDNGDKVINS